MCWCVLVVVQAINKSAGGVFTDEDSQILRYMAQFTGISLRKAELHGLVLQVSYSYIYSYSMVQH